MNQGLPNTTSLVTKLFLASKGITGIVAWVLQQIIVTVGVKEEKEVLAWMDEGHLVLILKVNKKNFDTVQDDQWALADGKILTKEQADAINDPFIKSLVDFGTLNRLRGQQSKT